MTGWEGGRKTVWEGGNRLCVSSVGGRGPDGWDEGGVGKQGKRLNKMRREGVGKIKISEGTRRIKRRWNAMRRDE